MRPGPVREQPTRVLGEKQWSRLTPPRPSGRPFAATRHEDNEAILVQTRLRAVFVIFVFSWLTILPFLPFPPIQPHNAQ